MHITAGDGQKLTLKTLVEQYKTIIKQWSLTLMMLEHIWVGGLAKILSGQKDNGYLDLSKAGELGHTQASEAI